MPNSSIWSTNRTLSGATTPGQSGPGNDGNIGILYIPQSSIITGSLASESLVPFPLVGMVLLLCRDAVGVFCSPSHLGLVNYYKHKYLRKYFVQQTKLQSDGDPGVSHCFGAKSGIFLTQRAPALSNNTTKLSRFFSLQRTNAISN